MSLQHPKPDPVKFCIHCGEQLRRKRFNGRLEDYGVFLRRRACGQSCANRRSDVGPAAYAWRARQLRGDKCERCGATKRLHAHHRDSNIANNTPENIATLCVTCHIGGHWAEKRAVRMLTSNYQER